MELCDKYLHECIRLSPTMNDFLKYDKYDHLRHIQRNHFKEDYDKKFSRLFDKYLDLLNRKKELTFYDENLKRGLLYSKRVDKYDFTDYLPLSAMDNIFYNIPSLIQGEMYFEIKTKKDIDDLVTRLKVLPEITKTVIELMKKGIRKGITMYKDSLELFTNDSLWHEMRNNLITNRGKKNWLYVAKKLISQL